MSVGRGDGEDALLGSFAGSYQIQALLGVGGMGRVYRAVHPELGKAAAVKVLAHALVGDADLERRFRVEAQAVARLEHPHIVEVLDFGTLADGRPFYTMELLRGESLHGFLARQRGAPVAVATLVAILEPVLGALAAAHAAGIVHRDLKPENVFLAVRGGAYVPKLLDFGVAKLLGEPLGSGSGKTQTGSLLGTPAYMSPEQATGQSAKIGPASDLYAMGVIAFEVLTGRPPFLASHLGELIHLHLTAPAPRLRSLRPDVPEALEALVDAALAKRPEDRPASAEAFARALRSIAPPQPITVVEAVLAEASLPPTRIARGSEPAKPGGATGSPGEPQASTLRTRRFLGPLLALVAALAAGAALATVLARRSVATQVAAAAPDAAVVALVPVRVAPADAAPAPPPDAAPPDAAPVAPAHAPRAHAARDVTFEARLSAARQAAANGDYASERRRAEEALALAPDDEPTIYLAGHAACMSHDEAGARTYYERLRDPHLRSALDELCTRLAGIYLSPTSKGSDADKQRRAYELYPQAVDALTKDPAEALRLALEVLALMPTHDGGWLIAASASCRLGKLDDTRVYLKKVPARMHDVVRASCTAAKQAFPGDASGADGGP